MRAFINYIEIDLPNNFKIARTKQVNNIGSISDRQSNYTQKVKIPKTKNNIIAFETLGLNGSNSNLPYQRNSLNLYNDNGESEIVNGFCKVFKSGFDFYDCGFYDGYISFAKAIENFNLSDLDLDEVNHEKTLTNVVDSFDDTSIYKYILADYNGKAIYDTNKINIDYLVPSLPVSYLWDKVFDTFGYTYEGSVFETFNFQNWWMTYPKGVSDTAVTPVNYYTNTFNNLTWVNNFDSSKVIIHNSAAPTTGSFLPNQAQYIAPEDGTYVITSDLSLTVRTTTAAGNPLIPHAIQIRVNGAPVGILQADASTGITGTNPFSLLLSEGDLLSLVVINPTTSSPITSIVFNSGTIEYDFLEGQVINFNDTFIDFKIKDFINEVLNRFALTPFLEKATTNIKFLTLDEIIQNPVDDWSASNYKFIEVTDESYILNSYAQLNNFVYKYNDKEGDYHDGAISINNYNLVDERNVFESKVYAPEFLISNVLPKETNVYKLWDKEVQSDGTVKYKDLDKRFYFMRSNNFTFDAPVTIGSEILLTSTTINEAPFESFFFLPLSQQVAFYYQNIGLILNDAKVINAKIFLNDSDINNLDFSKLKYIKELNNYYLLNKVSNYEKAGATNCELIRIKNA